MSSQINEKSYYSSIDGLRSVCFLLVFLFHCNINGFQLGWSGVVVFFVISGFLITEILINSKQSPSYYRNFYIRRLLRICPPYYTVIIGSILLFLVLEKATPNDLLYHITYTQNIYWVLTNYVSDLQPFLAHTWTLAIEEQFYLLWPLLIFLIPTKHLPKLCSVFIIIAITFRIIMVVLNYDYASSILLFSQIDSLALGASLACYKNGYIKNKTTEFIYRNSMFIGFAGIILIIVYNCYIYKIDFLSSYKLFVSPPGYVNNPFTIQIYFFVSMVSMGLLLYCYKNIGIAHIMLSNKVLVHIGQLSYGLYLYHWPLLVIINRFLPDITGVTLVLLLFTTTYTISIISFYSIEKYFRALKKRYT